MIMKWRSRDISPLWELMWCFDEMWCMWLKKPQDTWISANVISPFWHDVHHSHPVNTHPVHQTPPPPPQNTTCSTFTLEKRKPILHSLHCWFLHERGLHLCKKFLFLLYKDVCCYSSLVLCFCSLCGRAETLARSFLLSCWHLKAGFHSPIVDDSYDWELVIVFL